MAVPKRKKSRSRTRHRKSQWMRTPVPQVGGECPECGQLLRPHTVCICDGDVHRARPIRRG